MNQHNHRTNKRRDERIRRIIDYKMVNQNGCIDDLLEAVLYLLRKEAKESKAVNK